ncbi:MAG: hypothetical protein ACLGJD_10870 [Gammaproteobacteria bacterium]|uniref:hypothetical protein n=1 Tax=uncultured Pseudacidovorax sp. TaxID=679313 RepID=UPI0025D86DFC|nr:hypothetical protein [uncultured Pseudacidovorax sp.]
MDNVRFIDPQAPHPAEPPALPPSEIDALLESLNPQPQRPMTKAELEELLDLRLDRLWLDAFESDDILRKQLMRHMVWTVATSIVVPLLTVIATIKLI